MPANGVVLVRGARPPRRWPSVVVTVMVVFSLSLTGFLFFRDRQNAEAATGARSNAPQDALAMATLSRLAQTLDLDASDAPRRGRRAACHRAPRLPDARRRPARRSSSRAVASSGRSRSTAAGPASPGLRIAATRGWRWPRSASAPTTRRCSRRQGVTAAQFIRAEARVATRERAAIDAAGAAAAIASTSRQQPAVLGHVALDAARPTARHRVPVLGDVDGRHRRDVASTACLAADVDRRAGARGTRSVRVSPRPRR